jgi:hypothetical protein
MVEPAAALLSQHVLVEFSQENDLQPLVFLQIRQHPSAVGLDALLILFPEYSTPVTKEAQ